MTSSPDLINELRSSRPTAPAELRARVRELGSSSARRSPWATWRFPVRRGALIVVPAAAALAIAGAGVVGLSRSDVSPEASRQQELQATDGAATKGTAQAPPTALTDPRNQSTIAPATDRAQRVSATLTIEVPNADAVSSAAQDALDLTRSLGGHVVSSSVSTGEEGSASITVRVPVARVQDAITGLSGLGRIVSQQVTIDDLQRTLDELERQEAALRAQIARIMARLESEPLDAQTEAVLRARLQTLRNELRATRGGIAATDAEARMSTIQLTVATPGAFGAAASPSQSRLHRTIDESLNVLAWEGVILLGLLIVVAPFAVVAVTIWASRHWYRRREEERLLAT